jgi:hypothetical protein
MRKFMSNVAGLTPVRVFRIVDNDVITADFARDCGPSRRVVYKQLVKGCLRQSGNLSGCPQLNLKEFC